jgi:outer membrane protein OmpA-like peptidoglycan-associated protein
MGTDIYEMVGRGYQGSPAMAHLVEIGAHDGHAMVGSSYKLRKIQPNQRTQYLSWFDPASSFVYDGNPIVGQIFFPTADSSLDGMSDRVVLDAVIKWYQFELGQMSKVELEFVGHADPRGAASYNDALALKRAKAVDGYVAARITRNVGPIGSLFRYRSKATSRGETMPTGDNAADRRVDIVLRSVAARSNIGMPPLMFTAKNTGPLTRQLLFRGWGQFGASVKVVGVDYLEIEIKNANTGKSAFYVYTGANAGWSPKYLPVSYSSPSTDYTAREVPFGFVDVDDFEGPGSISSAAAGGGAQCLIFSGPKLAYSKKVLKKDGVEFCFTGTSWQVGASVGAGYWTKQPYNTEAGRADYLRRQAERQEKLERNGPKY